MNKTSNIIIIGGPISVGKTTLVNALPYPAILELNDNDDLMTLFLKYTYNKNRLNAIVIEEYFLQIRRQNYIKYADQEQKSVFDRSIFESLWFAKENMDTHNYNNFEIHWKNIVSELIIKFGKPKIYILLTCSWEVFKERLFERGREVEINNFEKNKEFFKKHILEYETHMIEIFNMFDIHYKKINTDNLSLEEIQKKSMDALEDL